MAASPRRLPDSAPHDPEDGNFWGKLWVASWPRRCSHILGPTLVSRWCFSLPVWLPTCLSVMYLYTFLSVDCISQLLPLVSLFSVFLYCMLFFCQYIYFSKYLWLSLMCILTKFYIFFYVCKCFHLLIFIHPYMDINFSLPASHPSIHLPKAGVQSHWSWQISHVMWKPFSTQLFTQN